ncbi:MAG: methyltransferase domain-containing protein [bacterium]
MNREILEVKEFFNRLASYYDLIYNEQFKEKTKGEITFLQNFLPKKGKILDIACGTGRHLLPLKMLGYEVIGIDLSKNMLQIPRNKIKNLKFNIKLIQGDMRFLPLQNQSIVGVICLFSSFCHLLTLDNQKKTVNEIYRILKNNGVVIIDVANWYWLKKQWQKKGEKIGIIPGTQKITVHLENRYIDNPLRTKLCHYTKEDLRRLFSIFPRVDFYGSFSLNAKFNSQSSRIIMVAKKKQLEYKV